mmetsp:Transcript_9486/g.15615  ORF Transcript_9486/g.15615 Transcript_9486/m.15615 type:complete len:485 (+) Transcript_9486:861-2315(+)
MRSQYGVHAGALLGQDVAEEDALGGGQNRGQLHLLDDFVDGRAHLHVLEGGELWELGILLTVVLHPPLLHVETQEPFAIALLVPAHPVGVLPLRQRLPRLNGLAKVALHQCTEPVDTQIVHQVLHARVLANLPVAVVPLRSDDALAELHHVLLGDEAQVFGGLGEGGFLVVRSAHTPTHHHIEAQQLLRGVVHDRHQPDVVDVDVDGVISRHGDGNLKLLGQVALSVERLHRVASDDALARVLEHLRLHVQPRIHLLDVFQPVLHPSHLLLPVPHIHHRGRLGLEQLCHDLRVVTSVTVGRTVERSRRTHDVPTHIAASTHSTGSSIHKRLNDSLQVSFQYSVHLPCLAGGDTKISLTIRIRHLIKLEMQIRRYFTSRRFKAKHKLIFFFNSPLSIITIVLHIRTMILHHDHGIIGQVNFIVTQFFSQWSRQIVTANFNSLNFCQLLWTISELVFRARWRNSGSHCQPSRRARNRGSIDGRWNE